MNLLRIKKKFAILLKMLSDINKLHERTSFLEVKTTFLQDEVSQLRSIMRHLVADKMDKMPIFQQTRDSFNYQWEQLPEGHAMLSSEEWKKEVTDSICSYADLPAGWFKGKKVMDAGCGLGRWTYGFGELEVGCCVSFDVSDAGVARTGEVASGIGDHFKVYKKNILEQPDFPDDFDLVWCYGVLHHTGNTYKGFQNLVKCVKPGGYLFLMLYAEPEQDNIDQYLYYHEMFDMRCKTRNLPFKEKVKMLEEKYGKKYVHGYFDAISPEINDLYRWDEIVSWFIDAGFEDIKRTVEHTNHHVIARKSL